MFIPLIYIILATLVKNQPSQVNLTAAIQIQNQTYFSSLPYFDSCDYNNSNMIAGQVNFIEVNPSFLYNKVVETDIFVFWSPVKNGLDIALALELQTNNDQYMGYILYNSEQKNFNRQIIFFNINQSGLIFYYTLLTVNPLNLQLTYDVINQVLVNLTSQALLMLKNCINITQSNFAYLGNQSFLFVCGQLATGFIFIPSSNKSQVTIIQLSKSVGVGSYQLASNPTLMINNETLDDLWACALLCNQNANSSNIFLITYHNQSFKIVCLEKEKKQLRIIVNRLWGQQAHVQFIRLMDLYSSFSEQPGLYFPGNITSIFVSAEQNIFVQSLYQGKTYLCVFDSEGKIYWNITFVGVVLYFGNQIILVYDQQIKQLLLVAVSRPLYIINASDFPNEAIPEGTNSFNITLKCKWVNIAINFSIYWSTIQYPTAYIQTYQKRPIYSDDSVHAVQTLQKFFIIGPDFHITPSPPPGIKVYIINSKEAFITEKTIAVFEVGQYSQRVSGILVVTKCRLVFVTTDGDVLTLVKNPCGFENITSAYFPAQGECILINQKGQACLCKPSLSQCSILIQNQNQNLSPSLRTFSSGNDNFFEQDSLAIKKNLYQLLYQNLVVTILSNNTIILLNFFTKQILDSFAFNCPMPNITNGAIFTQQFYRSSLILYCQGDSKLSQYMLISNSFIFQRIIPLYGFKTTSNFLGIQKTQAYIFMEVRPQKRVVPELCNCCVLRIDPSIYTISAIVQIIYAKYLVSTATLGNYNFVVTQIENILQIKSQQTLIKIYIPVQWISINQTNNSELVTQYQVIPMYFHSPFYNLQAITNIQITFNLTNANLNLISSNYHAQVQLFKIEDIKKTGLFEYKYLLSYDLGKFVCGPLFGSYIANTEKFQHDVVIRQSTPLLPAKSIGNSGIDFIQAINPTNWRDQSLTISNLLFLVSQTEMYVYAKQINNSQMVPIFNFTLPQNSCTYYLYQIINSTAINMTSNCLGINDRFQTPLLTLNYIPQNGSFTYNISYMQIPVAIRNIQTIHYNSTITYIIGILEGPTATNAGRLTLCYYQNCTLLNTSQNLNFLVDYSAFNNEEGVYLVIAIGKSTLDVFINPTVQPLNKTSINPNYTLQYISQLNQPFCSSMATLNVTQYTSQIILACSLNYYYLFLNYTSSEIIILNKFARYSQCNLLDQFKPYYIYENNTLQMFFAQCRQNDYKTALNKYVEVKKNTSAIYIGYLQVYSMLGPQGPNCENDIISPIRVIPISTSMDYHVFLSYKVGFTFKFIYEQMDGIVIDNIVQIVPSFSIVFKPASLNYEFPEIKFLAYNEFHQQVQIFQVGKKIEPPLNYVKIYIIFSIYAAANAVTLLFLLLYMYNGKHIALRLTELSDTQRSSNIKYFQTSPEDLVPPSKYSMLMSRHEYGQSKRSQYEIEMFFLKDGEQKGKKKRSKLFQQLNINN